MTGDLVALPAALIRPDRTFAGREVYRLPKVLLVLALFVVYVAGERLVQGYYQNEHAKTLAILEVDSRMSGIMQNAPSQVQRQMRDQMLDAIVGQRSALTTAFSIAFSGVGFLLILVEMWVVSAVASQFFGGQEERRGRDRQSWTLFLVVFFPLALRKLAAGIVMSLRNPEAAANALTLADYRRLSAVRFDFFSLLPIGGVNTFLATVASILTDPFFLWALAILCFGGREVYRMRMKSSIFLSLVLVGVFSLQVALLARIGVSGEI
ncbi:MAG: YIP1 family protein [Spirochaetia bacterium]|jgi:hypothetical protein